ncbi:hypothetical protein B0H17DRAFT_1215692 [Mycena rosella]|uniref:Uncharacterized protein n=1 Tax=Mycena rosella TaxID=1033263 RepID=A0AAD7CH96_MYCRO|nr:hypothetical protein B0H17DRAFT_1215692 [Mycena rosella]
MSSRANSPPDDLDNVYAAMTQSSPVRPSAANTGDKRPRTPADDDQSDTEETPATITVSGSATNQNFKRLRGEQKAEVADWLNDPPTLREAKAFVQAFHLENLITKIIVSQPPWAVSSDLETNIYSYGASILLSTKLSAYKGSVPKQILYVCDISFPAPAAQLVPGNFEEASVRPSSGIEHNPANWRKVTRGVEEALTQLRAKFKKAIGGSLKEKTKDKTFFPNADRKDIYQLTQDIAQGTQCEVNILLCACVAFMHKSYIKDSTVGFWNTVDADLVKIRAKAGGDPKKVAKAFRHILQADRKEHGVDDYEIEDAVDTFQQDVDKIVEAGIAAQPGPAEGEGDDDE